MTRPGRAPSERDTLGRAKASSEGAGNCGRLSCQGVKDWAIRGVVPSTLRDHGAQRALETLQFINLPTDVSNVLFGDALRLPTCHVPISREPKKRAHVLKGETQFACSSDEDQVLLISFGVEPVS